jgi:hypothetical protein
MTAPSTDYTTLQAQRRALLLQLAPLDQLRRGSLTEQYFTGRRKDGTRVQRGPYPLLTRKQGRKTVSVRVSDPALLPLYRQQLAAQRQFDAVVGQLAAVGEQLSDLAVSEAVLKKTPGGTGTNRRGAAPGRGPGRRGGP